jgi:hypothetical protein
MSAHGVSKAALPKVSVDAPPNHAALHSLQLTRYSIIPRPLWAACTRDFYSLPSTAMPAPGGMVIQLILVARTLFLIQYLGFSRNIGSLRIPDRLSLRQACWKRERVEFVLDCGWNHSRFAMVCSNFPSRQQAEGTSHSTGQLQWIVAVRR